MRSLSLACLEEPSGKSNREPAYLGHSSDPKVRGYVRLGELEQMGHSKHPRHRHKVLHLVLSRLPNNSLYRRACLYSGDLT